MCVCNYVRVCTLCVYMCVCAGEVHACVHVSVWMCVCTFPSPFLLVVIIHPSSAPQLVHKGNIDFLVSDYLSEITMSLLTAAKNKAPVS